LLHQAAELVRVPDSDLERLNGQAIGMGDHFRLHPSQERYRHGLAEATQRAAAGGGVVLVGRGTRQFLGGLIIVEDVHLVRYLHEPKAE